MFIIIVVLSLLFILYFEGRPVPGAEAGGVAGEAELLAGPPD